jgi:signal peptidase I
MKQILKIIYSVFVAFIVLVAALLIVSVLPITGNFKVLTVISGSMEPAIKLGSVVVVKPAAEYKVGDVITFGPYSKIKPPTTHRIYEIKSIGGQPAYVTKGDANNAPDARGIQSTDIVGKVLFDVPYVGYAVDFAKKPIGFAFIILVPAAIIIGDEVKKIIMEIKNKKNRTAG